MGPMDVPRGWPDELQLAQEQERGSMEQLPGRGHWPSSQTVLPLGAGVPLGSHREGSPTGALRASAPGPVLLIPLPPSFPLATSPDPCSSSAASVFPQAL